VRIAVISDIHSNLAALKETLNFLKSEDCDKIVCLGDIVGYGPRPNECIELIKKHCQVCLMGNHDHAVLGLTDTYHFNQYAREAVTWTRRTLTISNKAYLENLPFIHRENEILYVHSTPDHPEEWHYILSEFEAINYLKEMNHRLCFVGHSHIPITFSLEKGMSYDEEQQIELDSDKYIVNVGSVGQPRDGDHRLCFVIFDSESGLLKYIRLDYPVKETYNEILENNLPPFLAMRLFAGH
jgi:predicted phosphodiesterase